jgi:hypothetical protein
MTEDEYYDGEFTDGFLNAEADIAEYRRMVQEYFLQWKEQMDPVTYEHFRQYLEENPST